MIKKFRIPIKVLFSFFGVDGNLYEHPIKLNREVLIKTNDVKYSKINFLIKKFGNIVEYKLDDNVTLKCDENHKIRSNGKFIFIKNADTVDTITGNKKIISKQFIKFGDVYDVSIDSPHEYVTSSGIICHNTTLAKLLVKEVECDSIYINASDENGINVIREKIKGFASSSSFKPLKVVILDECLNEDTLVWVLRDGVEQKIQINELNDTSDLVKSFNIERGCVEWRPFILYDKGEQDVVKMELENGETVICTLQHKWYVKSKDNTIIKVKTQELLAGNYTSILTTEVK